MSKALTVLADCVDRRSGKHFKAGEVFDPAPTVDQAERLVAAGCLPEAAVEAAAKAQEAAQKAAEKKEAQERADAEATAKAEEAAKAERAELEKLTNPQIHALAADEQIAVETDDNKASLIDKIVAGRAAKG